MKLHPDKRKNWPNLTEDDHEVKSGEDIDYNCIAWATGENKRQFWPLDKRPYYWPIQVPFEETLAAFEAMFGLYEYERNANADPEAGYEKIAIYVDAEGVPTHAARQKSDGTWTSKLGIWEDIDHRSLTALEGIEPAYGKVAVILRRAVRA